MPIRIDWFTVRERLSLGLIGVETSANRNSPEMKFREELPLINCICYSELLFNVLLV